MTMSDKDKAIKLYIKDEAVVKRFKSHLEEQPNGCIEWTASKSSKGYGYFGIVHGMSVKAHRFAYALHYGIDKLPYGTDKTQKRKVLHHKCENKACSNPLHLEAVTDRWNLGIVNDKNMF